MDELPPKAAALLRAARREHDPKRADSERVRHALAAALVAPALSDAGGHASTLSKAASRWLSAGWVKGVAVVGLVAGATLVATWKPAQGPTPAPAQRARVVAAQTASVPEPIVPAAVQQGTRNAEPVAQVEAQPLAPAPVDARTNGAPQTRPAAATVSLARTRPEASPPQSVAEHRPREQVAAAKTSTVTLPAAQPVADTEQAPGELALMRRALERLNAGDTQGALDQLSLHATRFPNGVMTEERDGLRAVAWCKGADPARGFAAAHGFLRLYPDSPLVARVRGACKDGAQ